MYGYDRAKAIAYAHQWAYKRNPAYGDFSEMGGDCTNFVSQCLHAGGAPMNYTPTFGWYYNSLNSRAPAWTGVEPFYRFLTTNQKKGPYGWAAQMNQVQPGDVMQISFDGGRVWGHTALIVSMGEKPDPDNILVATHSYDSDNQPISHWNGALLRFIHIEGAR